MIRKVVSALFAVVRRPGVWVVAAAAGLASVQSCLPVGPETQEIELFVQADAARRPDSVTWSAGGRRGTATLVREAEGARARLTPPDGVDTVVLTVWAASMRAGQLTYVRTSQGGFQRLSGGTNAILLQLLAVQDSMVNARPGSSYGRDTNGLAILLAERLLVGDQRFKDFPQGLPQGIAAEKVDSIALLQAARAGNPIGPQSRKWLLKRDSSQAREVYTRWLASNVITQGEMDALFRQAPPPPPPPGDSPPSVVAPLSLSPKSMMRGQTVPIGGAFKADSGLKTASIQVLMGKEDRTKAFAIDNRIDLAGLPKTLNLADKLWLTPSDTAQFGTYRIVVIVSDSTGDTVSSAAEFVVALSSGPSISRIPNTTGDTVTVLDTTTTYTLKWTITDADNDLSTITINGERATLDGSQATYTVKNLQLDVSTPVVVEAIDNQKNRSTDQMWVYRPARVPPKITITTPSDRVDSVADSIASYTVHWTVTDLDLDSVQCNGNHLALSTDGKYSQAIPLDLPGDTTRIVIFASDKLGSRVTDTVKIKRRLPPDLRLDWLEVIEKTQKGDTNIALSDEFQPGKRIGRFEVTQAQYAHWMKIAPPVPSAVGLPARGITFYQAVLFCNAISKAQGLDTFYTYTSIDTTKGYYLADLAVKSDTAAKDAFNNPIFREGYRLPTTLEWDGVYLAGKPGPYAWGTSLDPLVVSRFAVWNRGDVAQVGSLQPTGIGLFDLAGNVAEWIYKNSGMIGLYTQWFYRGGAYSSTGVAELGLANSKVEGTKPQMSMGIRIIRVGE